MANSYDVPNFIDIIGIGSRNSIIPDDRPKSLYPSSASLVLPNGKVMGGCMRKMYYDYFRYSPTNPPSDVQLVKMNLGNYGHELVVDALKLAGVYAGHERRIYIPELRVSGRVDCFAYIRRPSARRRAVIAPLEIKTIYGYYGGKGPLYVTKDSPELKPKDEALMQLFLYLDYYRQASLVNGYSGPVFPFGSVIYLERGDGQRSQHTVYLEPVYDEEGDELWWAMPGTDRTIQIHKPRVHSLNEAGLEQEHTYEFTNVMMFERWIEVLQYINRTEGDNNEHLPPRDYTLQYSRERLQFLAEEGELTKTDTKNVEKGKYVEKGDWQCSYCWQKKRCWGNISKTELYNGDADKSTASDNEEE